MTFEEIAKIAHGRDEEKLKTIDPNAQTVDDPKGTILHHCALNAWADGVEYLLSHGANPTIEDKSGGNIVYQFAVRAALNHFPVRSSGSLDWVG